MGDEEGQLELGVGSGWCTSSPTDIIYGLPPDGDFPEDLLVDIEKFSYDNEEPKELPVGWSFNDDPSKLPQHTDNISVNFTPLQLHNLIHMVKFYSTKCDDYEAQGVSRDEVDRFEISLKEYAVIRPWTPYLKTWLKSINMYEYRKSQTGEFV